MVRRTVFVSIFLGLAMFLVVPASELQVRSLSFEDRVRAQEAIERVYYAHQIGATRPFEQVLTREVLERRVRTYLEQSVALEKLWDRPITSEALRGEWERIVDHTRYPDRLRQIAEALDWDSLLLYECLARPTLANRLVGKFYAQDERLHAEARHEVETVRALLMNGDFETASSRAQVHEVQLTRVDGEPHSSSPAYERSAPGERAQPEIVELDRGTYRARRSRAPRSVGQVSEIMEGRGAFEIRVVLEEGANHARIASYVVPKKGRDTWWVEVGGSFDAGSVTAMTELAGDDLRIETEHLLGFVGAFDPSCLPDDTWDNGTLEDPDPSRDGHSAIWTGTEMIVWGGGPLDSGLRYDPLLDVFTPTSRENAPPPRSFHTAIWTGSEMVVWGGWPLTTTGGRYDPVQDSWTAMDTDGAPAARFDHTAVWTGYAMIVWGGNEEGNATLGSGAKYFPAADVWVPITGSSAPQSRDRHTAVWTGREMIIWGGLGAAGSLEDGSRYDPSLDRWAALSSRESPPAKSDHIAVWTGTVMIIWGGSPFPNAGSRYDPVQDRWTEISTTGAPTVGSGEVGVWTGDELLVWRGTDPGDQGRYDPSTNSWSSMSAGPDGPPASLATAVWTGDLMIVWSPAGGSRYNPQTDDWSATLQLEAADAPSDRAGHTAVWTGNQMIVWGGPDSAEPLGSRYDPLLDSWTPATAVGAPAPRIGHTAVWTGDEMIVWGGEASGGLQESGGRYDPLTDSWQATTSIEAPQARNEHSAVWTGSEMLIWSGFVGGDSSTQTGCEALYTVTGSVYDPVADSWSAMTTTGASAGRGKQTAVWTGTEMLVWGGWRSVWVPDPQNPGEGDCNGPLAVADGGRYEPIQDAWTPITTSGEPAARVEHTAVWTDDVMIVWGGEFNSTSLGDGGRYSPTSDSWEPTTLDGAPAPRGGHSAIWTGSEMVIWGGGAFLDSGGRYSPEWDLWRETNLGGAPAARDAHTAVWTGDLMIVWGGSEPMGGRYALGHPDNDGDGLADGCLACPDGPDDDADGDGVACSSDNCPYDFNPTQEDDDTDGWGDPCDPCLGDAINDADLDLVCHGVDNCTSTYNPDQSDADGDGAGDACDDNDDDDSVPDSADNCRVVSNEDQSDADGDGAGDACDPCMWDPDDDVDGDGFCDHADNCPTEPNPTQSNVDGDGAGDACDICPGDPDDAVLGDGLCFAPQVRYPVDARPFSVAAGDFDGDGFTDLATANWGSNSNSTLFNSGDGSFALTTRQIVESRPEFVRAADFNSDGIADYVVLNNKWDPINPVPGSVSVFIGSVNGPLDRVDYSVGLSPESLTIDDFDQDGNLDLVVANRNTQDLSLLRGTPFGNFYNEIVTPTPFGRNPQWVSSGDFNNDRYPDLFVSISGDDEVEIYLNQGNGEFSYFAGGEVGTGGTIYSHAVGDFNEDGTMDVAVSHASSTYNLVTILRGAGNGQFAFVNDITAGLEGRSLQVGDLNWDGHDDIVIVNQGDWDLSILTGDGDEGFADEVRLPTGVQPVSITIADLTGDGRRSLAVANLFSNDVSVLLNLGAFGPSRPEANAGPSAIWIVPTESPAGATVRLDGSDSTDPDSTPGTADDIILYEWFERFGLPDQVFLGVGRTLDVFFSLGGHSITLRTTDKTGLSDMDQVSVTVMDAEILPDLTIEFTPSTLWPPNHRLVELQATIVPGPTCNSPSALLGPLSSTESDDAQGPADGETDGDIRDTFEGTADLTIQLRAERSALNSGRTYYVTYLASCGGNVKPLLYSFSVPYELNGMVEPLQIAMDETDQGTLVSWTPVAGAQHYDVIRGSLGNLQVLPDTYDLGDVACIEAESTDENTAGFEDSSLPGDGEVFFYLVQYFDEADSGYGTESATKPRIPSGGDCL